MTQPIDIISRALKDIGALEAGETPAPADAQDAFDMLNDMIDHWSNEQMMVFYQTGASTYALQKRWEPGQWVSIVSAELGLSGLYRIEQVDWTLEPGSFTQIITITY